MDHGYRRTLRACFISYIVQAIVNNFVPLLFLTFQEHYGISLSNISALITINFCVQLGVDLASAKLVDRIGYRMAMLLAHGAAALGLAGLAFLPELLPPFPGLTISVCIYALGGGLIEVVNSPMVEACPTENKQGTMSLLHSFYCWGHVSVVLLSTAFFSCFGVKSWKYLALLWALVPLLNGLSFLTVPIAPIATDDEPGMPTAQLLKNRTFLLLCAMMLCAGASEQGMSQWISAFAEKTLHVSKTLGDLAGPLSFAACMGIARALYGKYSDRVDPGKCTAVCLALCICSYLLAGLCSNAAIAFCSFALCGLSVGILWPSTFSRGAAALRGGGTAMFAFFALAGDIGCAAGPGLVGIAAQVMGDDLKKGLLAALVFPICLLLLLIPAEKVAKNPPKIAENATQST